MFGNDWGPYPEPVTPAAAIQKTRTHSSSTVRSRAQRRPTGGAGRCPGSCACAGLSLPEPSHPVVTGHSRLRLARGRGGGGASARGGAEGGAEGEWGGAPAGRARERPPARQALAPAPRSGAVGR